MLNFLRNFRRNMNGKYLKYAVGEIFLVVIGILIALSINNWNEDKKERAFENRMLKELKVAIDSDIQVFKRVEQMINSWRQSVLYLTDAANIQDKSTLNRDSVVHHMDVIWGFGVYIVYNKGPYEALKSSGLDKISDDKLRSQIAKLYSRDLPSLDIWMNEVIRKSVDEKFELVDKLFDLSVSRSGNDIQKELIIEDYLFLDSPLFADILDRSSNISESSLPSMLGARNSMESLSERIAQETQ